MDLIPYRVRFQPESGRSPDRMVVRASRYSVVSGHVHFLVDGVDELEPVMAFPVKDVLEVRDLSGADYWVDPSDNEPYEWREPEYNHFHIDSPRPLPCWTGISGRNYERADIPR